MSELHESSMWKSQQIQANLAPARTEGKMTKLRMKCPHCRCWNRIEVDRIFVPQPSSEPQVKVLIPMYKPLKTERCEKCGKVIAEPQELLYHETRRGKKEDS